MKKLARLSNQGYNIKDIYGTALLFYLGSTFYPLEKLNTDMIAFIRTVLFLSKCFTPNAVIECSTKVINSLCNEREYKVLILSLRL